MPPPPPEPPQSVRSRVYSLKLSSHPAKPNLTRDSKRRPIKPGPFQHPAHNLERITQPQYNGAKEQREFVARVEATIRQPPTTVSCLTANRPLNERVTRMLDGLGRRLY